VWDRACAIICKIVGVKVGIDDLYSEHIPCGAAGMTMGAVDRFLEDAEFINTNVANDW
jgi:hypothetical protein